MGVHTDEQLRFDTHVNELIRKLSPKFLSSQMYNCFYGYVADHLAHSIVMACHINDVNTRNSCTMNTHVPYCRIDILNMSFIYCESVLWIGLPSDIQESLTLDHF